MTEENLSSNLIKVVVETKDQTYTYHMSGHFVIVGYGPDGSIRLLSTTTDRKETVYMLEGAKLSALTSK